MHPICTVCVAVLVTMVAVTACKDTAEPESSAQRSPSPPARSITAAPSAEPRAAALAAYRGMWSAFVAASNSGATVTPALATYTSGSALQVLNRGLATNKRKAVTSKGSPAMSPMVTSIRPVEAPTSAMITDCVDDTRWLLYGANGRLVDDVPGGRRHATAKVEKTNGVWKVTGFALRGTGTC